MPIRDRFRSPVNDKLTWSEFYGGWPAMIVRQLYDILPVGYVSGPGVRRKRYEMSFSAPTNHLLPQPTLTLETDLPDQDEFEVRVYDADWGRQLVAAIEIVSPANKDRPESRRAFVAKVAALLQQDVCVSIVDLVTIRQFNLYADLLDLIGGVHPQLGENPPHLYSVTIRTRSGRECDRWSTCGITR